MFRNESSEQNSSASAGLRGSLSGLDCQESPWLGVLSVLSRPALSLLNRILPDRRIQTTALSDPDHGWLSGVLDDLESGPKAYLQSEAGGVDRLLETRSGLKWLPASSLDRLGYLEDLEDLKVNFCQHSQLQHRSTVSTALQVLGRSVPDSGGKDWGFRVSGGDSGRCNRDTNWCGSLWGDGVGTAELLQDLLGTGTIAPQLANQMTAADAALNTWTGAENSGAPDHKEKPGLHPDHHPNWSKPDQDHGYSSLEEEQVQKCPLLMETLSEEVQQQDVVEGILAPPHCQNKAIAFIMGCPCSDEDDSQSEASGDEDDSQSDATFDEDDSQSDTASDEDNSQSEATGDEDDSDVDCRDFSDSSVDHRHPDEDRDRDPEGLWSSMNRSPDPYNRQCFSPHLCTGTSSSCSQPQAIHASPSPPPNQTTSSPSSWDDSASEVDEAESLHLWSSFSCSSDPYSPLNFQAPVRTIAPPTALTGAGVEAKTAQTHATPSHPHPAAPPHYGKEKAEEKLNSGFSEPCTSSDPCKLLKKVRFSDHVEEFFTEEEDRRGPWEEFARDRCRFLRRCLEVEQSIAFCLQPQHRLRVYQRLSTCSPDSQSETSSVWRPVRGSFTA